MTDSQSSESPPPAERPALSHLVEREGVSRARMVDVGGKDETDRSATASARLRFPAGLLAEALAGRGPKGPIEEMARAAGVLAAKGTSGLIPMCHPLGLDQVDVEFSEPEEGLLEVRCHARCRGRTGVEMEAMTGAAVAALTVYDMTKALHKGIVIERIALEEKTGGKSGTWRAPDPGGV